MTPYAIMYNILNLLEIVVDSQHCQAFLVSWIAWKWRLLNGVDNNPLRADLVNPPLERHFFK